MQDRESLRHHPASRNQVEHGEQRGQEEWSFHNSVALAGSPAANECGISGQKAQSIFENKLNCAVFRRCAELPCADGALATPVGSAPNAEADRKNEVME